MRNAVRFDHIETGWIEAMEATRIYGFSKYRGAREHSIKIVVSISLSKEGISDCHIGYVTSYMSHIICEI